MLELVIKGDDEWTNAPSGHFTVARGGGVRATDSTDNDHRRLAVVFSDDSALESLGVRFFPYQPLMLGKNFAYILDGVVTSGEDAPPNLVQVNLACGAKWLDTVPISEHLQSSATAWGGTARQDARTVLYEGFLSGPSEDQMNRSAAANTRPVPTIPYTATLTLQATDVAHVLGRDVAFVVPPEILLMLKPPSDEAGSNAQARARDRPVFHGAHTFVVQEESGTLSTESTEGRTGLPLLILQYAGPEPEQSPSSQQQPHQVQFEVDGILDTGEPFNSAGSASVHSFGATSASCERASMLLRVDGGSGAALLGPRGPHDLREVVLLSLCHDRGGGRNYAALSAAANVGLVQSAFAYVEVQVSGAARGVYLLVETPTGAMRRAQWTSLHNDDSSLAAVIQRVNSGGNSWADILGPFGFSTSPVDGITRRTTPFEERAEGLEAQTSLSSYSWCASEPTEGAALHDNDFERPCGEEAKERYRGALFNPERYALRGQDLVAALRESLDLGAPNDVFANASAPLLSPFLSQL